MFSSFQDTAYLGVGYAADSGALIRATVAHRLAPLVDRLMNCADEIFGDDAGSMKHEWVKAATLDALRRRPIDRWAEDDIHLFILDLVIETLWATGRSRPRPILPE